MSIRVRALIRRETFGGAVLCWRVAGRQRKLCCAIRLQALALRCMELTEGCIIRTIRLNKNTLNKFGNEQ